MRHEIVRTMPRTERPGTRHRLAAALAALALAAVLAACGSSDGTKVKQPGAQFVYVANTSASTISGFSVDPSTGALADVPGSPFPAPPSVERLAVDPDGKYLFAGSLSYTGLYDYEIDPATGQLTQMASSPAAIGQFIFDLAVHPSGDYVLASRDGIDILMVFGFDPADGSLDTTIPGSPHTTGGDPFGIGIDPTGNFIYTANNVGGDISGFTMIPASGALGTIVGSPFTAGVQPRHIAVDPASRFAYMADDDTNVYAFFMNSATGALAPTTPASFALPSGSIRVAVDPTGQWVYFLEGATRLYKFDIGSDGALSNRKTYAVGTIALGLDISPSGDFLFTSDEASNALHVWGIGSSSGSLFEVSGSPYLTGNGPRAVVAVQASN